MEMQWNTPFQAALLFLLFLMVDTVVCGSIEFGIFSARANVDPPLDSIGLGKKVLVGIFKTCFFLSFFLSLFLLSICYFTPLRVARGIPSGSGFCFF